MKTRYLALTGGIASGKSHVSAIFEEDPLFTVIDADITAHELTQANTTAIESIQNTFGKKFIAGDGSLNRKKMRQLIFNDPAAKTKLESIIHPMIRTTMDKARESATTPFSISVIPLLVESGAIYHDVFERIIVIDCPSAQQLQRLIDIRGIDTKIANKIIKSQASRRQRIKIADDVLYNDDSLDALSSATRLLINWYRSFYTTA